MGQIIELDQLKTLHRKPKSESNDLTDLLKKAKLLQKNFQKILAEKGVIGIKNFQSYIESCIFHQLLVDQLIAEGYFHCATYISSLMEKFIKESPASWFAFDHHIKHNETGDPSFLEQGGDTCFLICSIFKERADFRSMNYEDYARFGESFYYQSYLTAQRANNFYFFHMSDHFRTMADVTRKSVIKT